MKWYFQQMTQEVATVIANDWKYEGEYAFYDATADEEDYQELIQPEERGNNYYEAFNHTQLAGYFVIFLLHKHTAEIGLGLRPELTGGGVGIAFLQEILSFLQKEFPAVTTVELSVAAFNKRAIKVYKRAGFEFIGDFRQKTNGGEYDFVKMSKRITAGS